MIKNDKETDVNKSLDSTAVDEVRDDQSEVSNEKENVLEPLKEKDMKVEHRNYNNDDEEEVYASVLEYVSKTNSDFNARNKCLTAKLLQQGYRYHKLRKTFSKFYRRHYELISKYNVGLKTLLSEGLSEPEFYGDLVYKLKKLKGINDFSLQFGKIISRYRRIGYNLNVMRQSACLVFNPIMVDNYAAFFNCTPVGRASDSMMAPT